MHHDSKKVFPTGRNGRKQIHVSWAFFLLPYLEETNVYAAYKKGIRVDDPTNSQAMRTPIDVYACPSRRRAAADRNFDDDDNPPKVLAAATLGDYAANAGEEEDTGMDDIDDANFVPINVDKTKAGPIFSGSRYSAKQITDGLSSTIAIGERHIRPVPTGTAPEMEHYSIGDTAFLAGDTIETILAGAHDSPAKGPDDHHDHIFGGPHSGVVQFVFLDGHVDAISNDIDEKTMLGLCTIAGGEVVQKP
jgi:prepilin-type processing-associated H-X9-DG protein